MNPLPVAPDLLSPRLRAALIVAGAAGFLGTLLYFVSDLEPKRRIRRDYSDPGIRSTRRLSIPHESMQEVVYGRRR